MNRVFKYGPNMPYSETSTPYKNSSKKRRELPKPKDSNIEIFDNKIASLNRAKTQAVENEEYQEADKLKQVISKIEKLKSHIRSLENKKSEYANSENYEQAKKIK